MYILSCFKHNKLVYYIFLSLLFVQTISDEVDLTVNDAKIFELNSLYVIEQIKFSKNSNDPFDYLFGIFVASNSSTFSDFMPIGMIKESDLDSDEISLSINAPFPYQYIKYNPPSSNRKAITEIKITGHAFSEGENLSSNSYFKPTGLPLLIINTKNSEEPLSLENYIDSTFIIINNNEIEVNGQASIRLRGHSTATRPKKPYKIKFKDKQKILGLGAFKKWAILANHYDKSLIRNILAFKISEIVELNFTPTCKPVDVIVNGNFRGNYFICDQIDIKKEELTLTKIKVMIYREDI